MTQSYHPFRSAADLGRLIKTRRKDLNMTQADLALQSGISVPTIIAAEKGKETARIGVVLTLCADLGIALFADV